MYYFTKSTSEVLQDFSVDKDVGLFWEKISENREKYGKNSLPHRPGKSLLAMIFSQLNDWLIYILLGAVVLTIWHHEYIDAAIIVAVIVVNAVLGVIQEFKAGKAVEALRNMTSPQALVRREGKTLEIPSEEVVVGDILVLDAGRIIAADIRLLESEELFIDESALTGESLPVQKSAEAVFDDEKIGIGDRKNMAFMSTIITNGRGLGLVIWVGENTEVGHIAGILENEERALTPLEMRLEHLGKTLGKMAIAVCALIFVIGYFQGRDLHDVFLLSVSLAVASIPEGLAAIVAVVLSIGVTKMSKKNAIIKRLSAVETLGSVSIICSDKTGTLTQNKMTVVEIFSLSGERKITPSWQANDTEKLIARGMSLASDATFDDGVATGDPTEVALLWLADAAFGDHKSIIKNTERIAEFPFDSIRKMMSVEIVENGEKIVYTKGAIDNILEKSTHIFENGKEILMTPSHRKGILENMQKMSDRALRTLGLAYKKTQKILKNEEMEKNLVFVGMVGMIDPPRIEVKDSIEVAKNAGITPIMITGDYPNTAFAIAKELGIAEDFSQAITGKEIDEIDEKTFTKRILDYRVFARVSPEHKVKIVRALRSHGNIVSMTGDGVNDAPSLNAANIGVAMGITGTDVAKGAADVILLDDNFTTIVNAVEQGRIIYNNIKKSIIFLLSCNLGEVVAMVFVLLAGWQSPLLAVQLLWINLVTDSLPAVALGMDRGDKEVMNEKPRSPKESFFSQGGATNILFFGVMMGLVTILAFWYGISGISEVKTPYTEALASARTLAFMTLIFTQMFFALSIRSEYKTVFSREIFANKILIATVFGGIFLQIMVLYTPFLREIFHLGMIRFEDWGIILGLSVFPMILNEIRKFFRKKSQ